jgi:hypothetical protein
LRRQFGLIPPIGAAMLGLYLVDKTTAVHSTSGIETTLFVALLCLSYFTALWFLEAPGWRAAILIGLAVFLSALGRLEGVLYGVTLYAVLFAYVAYRKWKFGGNCSASLHQQVCLLLLDWPTPSGSSRTSDICCLTATTSNPTESPWMG